MMYVIGIDPGFGAAPTGCALLDFTDQPRLVGTRSLHPRCGGDWQRRVKDVLAQLRDYYLTIEIPPFFDPPLVLAYELAHLRAAKEAAEQPLRKGRKERANSVAVLNPQTALRLESLGGGVRGLAVAYGLECIGVSSAESKQALTGNTAADKQAMIAAAQRIFGRDLSEHEADAVGHALAGEAAVRRARLVREAVGR